MLYRDAKSLALSRDLDLVQVNKDGTFKIMDHGKYKYDRKKNKQKKTAQPLKEMTFKMRIDPHDVGIKINQIKRFLLKGSDVKIAVTMRGRERASPQLAQEKLDSILKELEGLVAVQQTKSARSSVFVTVRPLPGAKNALEEWAKKLKKSVKKDDDKEPAYVCWQTVRREDEQDIRERAITEGIRKHDPNSSDDGSTKKENNQENQAYV